MRHKHLPARAVRPRAGAVLICVLACTLIAMSLAAASIHLALQGARASKQNLRLRQTQWLLQAGVQRARQALQEEDYDGEEWLVPDGFLPESQGRVVIEVSTASDGSEGGLQPVSESSSLKTNVTVTAEYGRQGLPPIRRSHTFSVDREASDEGSR